jgi:hypothetical protein
VLLPAPIAHHLVGRVDENAGAHAVNDKTPDPHELLRRLRPLHAVVDNGSTRVVRLPGRPARARVAPSHDEREYLTEVLMLQNASVGADHVVRAAEAGVEVLDHVAVEVAREVASLRFERGRLSPAHPNAGILTGRIIAGMTKLADILLMRAKLGGEGLDVQGRQFRAVFDLFIHDLREVVDEVVPDSQKFMTAFMTKIEGWETNAVSSGSFDASVSAR